MDSQAINLNLHGHKHKSILPGGMLLDTIHTLVVIYLKALKRTNFIDHGFMILGKHLTYMWMTHTFFALYYASSLVYGLSILCLF